MSHEITTLFTRVRWLVALEHLSRIASSPAYKPAPIHRPEPMPLIDRPWFITGMYVVCALVIGSVISKVIA
jgi:hypothetical protein